MKLIVLTTVFIGVFAHVRASPQRMILPRLPLEVVKSGRYQLIPSDKIIGGTEVEPNSLPFQISLQRGSVGLYTHSCGGSILNATTILDAAHCVDGAIARGLRIVAGEHDMRTDSGLEQYRDVESYDMHPRYTASTYEDDIALIYLTEPLDLSGPEVQPVNLPPPTSEYDPPAGTNVTVSGWGVSRPGGVLISEVLLSVDLPVVSDADCNMKYGGTTESPKVFSSMICAGDTTNGGIDSCQGDSGGPLFTRNEDGKFVQHGIVSWGRGCAEAAYPGVYTQVSYFLEWIALVQGL